MSALEGKADINGAGTASPLLTQSGVQMELLLALSPGRAESGLAIPSETKRTKPVRLGCKAS